MDLQNLNRLLRQECQLDSTRLIVVGVSGGPDSLCLLDALHCLGYPLLVAHFDHCLRPESGEDARKVAQMAAERGLSYALGKEEIARLASVDRLSVEEAARKARYRFLFDQARQCQAQAVAVGHTADDQVETVLMHLLRGAGISGLKGMTFRTLSQEWDINIPLVRPLLSTWRAETVAYCQERGLSPLFDHSNLDTTFFRNRLRHELIPYLRQYNPQIESVIWRMSQALSADYAILEDAVETAWCRCWIGQGTGYVALALPEFRDLPLAHRRSVLRRALAMLRPALRDIDFNAIERGLSFIESPSRLRKTNLVCNLTLLVERERLLILDQELELQETNWPQLKRNEEKLLFVPGEIALQNGWALQAETIVLNPREGFEVSTQDPYQAYLDLDVLEQPLVVRARRPGDRFQPLGLGGHSMKLADFMINVRLPRWRRESWPVVASGDRIAWLPGYRPAHFCRVQPTTDQVVHLCLKRGQVGASM